MQQRTENQDREIRPHFKEYVVRVENSKLGNFFYFLLYFIFFSIFILFLDLELGIDMTSHMTVTRHGHMITYHTEEYKRF